MKNVFLILAGSLILSSCLSDELGRRMEKSLKKNGGGVIGSMQRMLADQEFKRAIASIELHKIRNGEYPSTLDSLQFINPMDSSFLYNVQYTPMDSVYGLDLTMPGLGLKKRANLNRMRMHYPDQFWQGLGCVESNMK